MSSFSGLQHTLRSSQGPLRLRLGDGRRSRWALEHPSCSHTHQARGWLRHQRVQHPWATPPRCMPLRKALPALPCLPATDEDLQFVYLKKGEKKKKKEIAGGATLPSAALRALHASIPRLPHNAFFPRGLALLGRCTPRRRPVSATPKHRPLRARGSVSNLGLLFGNRRREAEAGGTKAAPVGAGDLSRWNA